MTSYGEFVHEACRKEPTVERAVRHVERNLTEFPAIRRGQLERLLRQGIRCDVYREMNRRAAETVQKAAALEETKEGSPPCKRSPEAMVAAESALGRGLMNEMMGHKKLKDCTRGELAGRLDLARAKKERWSFSCRYLEGLLERMPREDEAVVGKVLEPEAVLEAWQEARRAAAKV